MRTSFPELIPPCSPRKVTLSGGLYTLEGGKSTRDTFREGSELSPAWVIPERGLPDPFGGESSAHVLLVFADPVQRDPPRPAERSDLLCNGIRVHPVSPQDMEHDQPGRVRVFRTLTTSLSGSTVRAARSMIPSERNPSSVGSTMSWM